MKLDISRIKMIHGALLPEHEPSIPQNTRRREQSSTLLAAYHGKIKEQSRFELHLGHSTGRLQDILQPRIIAPTLPGAGYTPPTSEKGYVLEQANMYVGRQWPTETPWGSPFRSGITSPVADAQKFQYVFAHLGMLPETYGKIWNQIGQYENFIIDNNKKPPASLFVSALKKAEWQALNHLAIDEARTSYAYHVNKMNDDLRVYLHIDFIYRDNVSPDQYIQFTFPENEEQKAIWRNVFWGESLPQFPVIPEAFAVPKSPSLMSDTSSSFSSRNSSGASSAGMQRQSGNLLVDELGRSQIQPQNSARGSASKDPFFM